MAILTKFCRRMLSCVMACAVPGAVVAADYQIDPSHAFVQFRILHLGYSLLPGRFNTLRGNFQWDKAHPELSRIEVTIDTASIDTNWAERDKHLRSANFLSVDEFPTAKFISTGYTGDAASGTLEGKLSLHGVTRAITLQAKVIGEGRDPWGGYRAGFFATTTIKRSDFRVNKFELGPASDPMKFELMIEGIRQ